MKVTDGEGDGFKQARKARSERDVLIAAKSKHAPAHIPKTT